MDDKNDDNKIGLKEEDGPHYDGGAHGTPCPFYRLAAALGVSR